MHVWGSETTFRIWIPPSPMWDSVSQFTGMVWSDLPPEPSDQTSWFLVRSCCYVHSRTDRCPWVLPICPSRCGTVSMGADRSHYVLVWFTGTQWGLSYYCCPLSGSSQHWHHCWNDAKLCCGYTCAIKPETQRRHHLRCMFPSARDSEYWLLSVTCPRRRFSHQKNWRSGFHVCLSQTLKQCIILFMQSHMPLSIHSSAYPGKFMALSLSAQMQSQKSKQRANEAWLVSTWGARREHGHDFHGMC